MKVMISQPMNGVPDSEVEKNQIRRSTFLGDDYYLVLYAEHKVSGHNYCIIRRWGYI